MWKKSGLMMLALLTASTVLAAEAGRVVFTTGVAQVGQRPAVLGEAVQEGDRINTGADGYIYVKTVDSGFLILRPNSHARVVIYHIDNDNPANTRVKLELTQGVARSISGVAVKQARQNFRFNTPVAAIGVRGTDFVVYTDQQTSRVAVMSGGIVMAGFGGNCGPEGGGPCEGGASRELFAGQQGQLLQVQRGHALPQLMSSPALQPDQAAPARSDEPSGKPTPALGAGTQTVEPNLDAQKADLKLSRPNSPVTTETPPLVIVTPEPTPELPAVAPLPPSPPEVLWGRWRDVAGRSPDPRVTAELNSGKYARGMILGSYDIRRLNDTALVMPREGQVSFKLDSGEAMLQRIGDQPLAATMKDGHLDINFVNRSFNTGLTLVSPTEKMTISGFGDVTTDGVLASGFTSPTRISGYLGGKNATEAVYLFQVVGDLKMKAEGVARWKN